MAVETDFELGEVLLILGAVIFIGYMIYKAAGSAGNALSSLGTAVSNGASSALSAVKGLGPTQSLPSCGGGVTVNGTPYNVSDLIAAGWSQDQISQLLAQSGGVTMRAKTGSLVSPCCSSSCPGYLTSVC